MLKALVFDIDGTLIGSDKRISDLTRREIHRVHRDHGVEVVIATARGLDSAQILADRLALPSSIIAFGGAVVVSRPGAPELVDQKTLPTSEVDVLVRAAEGLDVYVAVHSLTKCYINRFDYWARREIRNTGVWPEVVPSRGWSPPVSQRRNLESHVPRRAREFGHDLVTHRSPRRRRSPTEPDASLRSSRRRD